MKLSHLALVVALSAITAFAVGKYTTAPAPSAAKQETAFERVMRTGTLRCGYAVMPPQLSRDPNTGAMSGVSYDILTEAAKRLNIKVDWAEEITFMTVAEGFKSARYDSFCLTAYRWVPWARAVEFTTPLFYSTTDVYVRTNDHRFDANAKAIDSPTVTVAAIDGEASTFIRAQDFPQSATYSMPLSTDLSLVLEAVASNKADVALANPLTIMPYLTANPGKIQRAEGIRPIRAYAHSFVFGKGEHDLTSMFDVVLTEMLTDGTIDKILDKYEAIPDSFVRIKSPIAYHEKTETK